MPQRRWLCLELRVPASADGEIAIYLDGERRAACPPGIEPFPADGFHFANLGQILEPHGGRSRALFDNVAIDTGPGPCR